MKPSRSRSVYRWSLFLFAITTWLGCAPDLPSKDAAGPELRKISLALNWFPEAEHGGFYAALVHGYFRDEGLDVDIRSGGPGAPTIQQVAGGQIEFAVANADQVLLGRDQGAPVVAVMTAMQNSPRCIMVHQRSGIDEWSKLRDITLAVGSGKPFAKFLLSKLGNTESIKIVPFQGSVATFLQRDDFAQQAYVFSEPFVAQQAGGDPYCLLVSDLGFNPYTSLLITNEALIRSEAELVKKVVRACRRGWRKYLDEPTTTNEHIHKQNEEMSLEILAYGADQIRPLCLPAGMPKENIGQMEPARWKELAEQLVEIGLIGEVGPWESAFDSTFAAN